LRHIFLDTKLAFPYIALTKKRPSEGDHPPDGKGCDGIESVRFDYRVGTMIEIPRAALTADEIAAAAEFFSFGTPTTSPDHLRLLPERCGWIFALFLLKRC
jgi:hypothetical protein